MELLEFGDLGFLRQIGITARQRAGRRAMMTSGEGEFLSSIAK
jgi:hypothetical protein